MGKLDGKVALISGGARGQGAAEVRTFAREGARVVFGDVADDDGRQVEAELQAAGQEVAYVHLDVSSEADWRQIVDETMRRFGRLDVLVNNAGITIPRVPIEVRSEAEWDRIMAVNAKGVFLGTKHAIPEMRKGGGGSIINISSVAGIGQSAHQEPAYAASKAAVRIFSKVTAAQCAQDNIRCNSVHPGPVDTDMLHSAMPDPEVLRQRLQRVPLRRRRNRRRRAVPGVGRLLLRDGQRTRDRRRRPGAIVAGASSFRCFLIGGGYCGHHLGGRVLDDIALPKFERFHGLLHAMDRSRGKAFEYRAPNG